MNNRRDHNKPFRRIQSQIAQEKGIERANIITVEKTHCSINNMVATVKGENQEVSPLTYLKDKWEIGGGCSGDENVCVGTETLHMCDVNELQDFRTDNREDDLSNDGTFSTDKRCDASQEEGVKDSGIEMRVDLSDHEDENEHEDDLAFVTKKIQMLETSTSDDVVTTVAVESSDQKLEFFRGVRSAEKEASMNKEDASVHIESPSAEEDDETYLPPISKNVQVFAITASDDEIQPDDQHLSISASKSDSSELEGSFSESMEGTVSTNPQDNENRPPSSQGTTINTQEKIDTKKTRKVTISIDPTPRQRESKVKPKIMKVHQTIKSKVACERSQKLDHEETPKAYNTNFYALPLPKKFRSVPKPSTASEEENSVPTSSLEQPSISDESSNSSYTDELSDILDYAPSTSSPQISQGKQTAQKKSARKVASASSRLYNSSKVSSLQEEGRKRREAIAKASAKKKELPVFSDETVPLSQASDFYKKSMKKRFEKERKLEEKKQAAVDEREKNIPKFNETIPVSKASEFYKKSMRKAHEMKERIEDKRVAAAKSEDGAIYLGQGATGTVPLSQASDFYHKSVRWAILEERRRALTARDRQSSYEPLYKFNLMK